MNVAGSASFLCYNPCMPNVIKLAASILILGLFAHSTFAQPAGNTAAGGSAIAAKKNPVIRIKTEFGEITAELYADKAAITVANFLHYITEKQVHNPTFYRVVHISRTTSPIKR